MKELLDKISSYNLFNYLFPGILCSIALDHLTNLPIMQPNIVIGVFVYYFVGVVVSRIGSLLISPVLQKLKIVEFSSYSDFISASTADPKLEVLSEVNNMYRTLIAAFIFLGLVVLFQELVLCFELSDKNSTYLALFILFILFIYSYRKQTQFITSRVSKHTGSTRTVD